MRRISRNAHGLYYSIRLVEENCESDATVILSEIIDSLYSTMKLLEDGKYGEEVYLGNAHENRSVQEDVTGSCQSF